MTLPPIDKIFLQQFLMGLLNTPSPTGHAEEGIDFVEKAVVGFSGLVLSHDNKGGLLVAVPGLEGGAGRALTAHVDTLGAMVREVKASGRLRLTALGGLVWNSVEGEGCTVFTGEKHKIRGSLMMVKSSSHVFGAEVIEAKRDDNTMEVRLDEHTHSAAETRALGIEVGDFVAFDCRVETHNGFIRSRHLDDKACVACLVAALKALDDTALKPKQKTWFYFSNYEEVGHGGAGSIPADAGELLVVDMAAVGEGQNSDEFHATLCVKDSSGPYHNGLSQRLRRMAEEYKIAFKMDTYPYYASDGSAHWRAGGSAAVALIGPGVDGSHNYERTHLDALLATTHWVLAYLLN
jgi:putative aminopeptidase FrvX